MIAKLAFLPEEYARQIIAFEAVDVGTHQVYRCHTRAGQLAAERSIWYLKSVKAPTQRSGLQLEIATSLQLQHALQHVNVAQLLWAADNGEHAVFTEVPGRDATKKQVTTELPSLLMALKEVHGQAVAGLPLPTWRVEDLGAEINSLGTDPEVTARLFEQVNRLQEVPFGQPSYLGFVHGDLNAGNVLYEPKQKRWGLLDWECAQFTDVRWDLASICVEFALSAAECDDVFQQYATLTNINVDQFVRYQQSWQTFYRLTCLVWAIKHNYPTERYQIS